jgi:hypothetical protein
MGLEQLRQIREQRDKPKEKKKYSIPKVSKKRQKQLNEQKAERISGGNELDRWFNDRRRAMTGLCANCGKPSCKNSDQYFKHSIAHILPKAYVKSVATNEFNWLELCFWGENSCHTQMDNGLLDLTEMACWDEIVIKFQKMYPSISKKERRRIPEILLKYINIDV